MSTPGTEVVEERVPVAQWHTVQIGERIIGIDGYGTTEPLVVVDCEHAGIIRVQAPEGAAARRLYPGNHESVTVVRRRPIVLTQREAAALRRNAGSYVPLLRALVNGPRLALTRGEGVRYASMADTYGYDWTERGPRVDGVRGWQITERGHAALRFADANGIGAGY